VRPENQKRVTNISLQSSVRFCCKKAKPGGFSSQRNGDSGVTRLDVARGNKQVWRPHVRTWALVQANLSYWRKYMWHFWDFRRPIVIRRPENCAPVNLITLLHGEAMPAKAALDKCWNCTEFRVKLN